MKQSHRWRAEDAVVRCGNVVAIRDSATRTIDDLLRRRYPPMLAKRGDRRETCVHYSECLATIVKASPHSEVRHASCPTPCLHEKTEERR